MKNSNLLRSICICTHPCVTRISQYYTKHIMHGNTSECAADDYYYSINTHREQFKNAVTVIHYVTGAVLHCVMLSSWRIEYIL